MLCNLLILILELLYQACYYNIFIINEPPFNSNFKIYNESSTTNRLPLAVVSSGSHNNGYSESHGGPGVQGVQRLIII